ncbi:MAG: hypothetical protein RQ864_12070 [Lutibacter sp.]|nr:hypothetical protein [Lutibacter sp.]
MRNFIFIAALSISLWSCGGGGGEQPAPPPVVNTPPTAPTLVYPTNNLLCIDNVLKFKWEATDAEGGVITYQIEVSKNAQFTQLVHNVTSTTTLITLTMEKGIAYYWRAKATDNKNAASSYSATNQFYTEGLGVVNHLPFSPVLLSPALNKVVKPADYFPLEELNVILEWSAIDVDAGDALTYDVYFGTSTEKDNLPKVSPPNQSAKTFTVAPLAASTTYYWRVEVKDNKGGQTVGQVWNFTTD